MNNSSIGQDLIDFFRQRKFPIAIPSVFQTNAKTHYIRAKLISDKPIIRYRYDTLTAGLNLIDEEESQLFQQKLNLLNDYIENSDKKESFLLKEHEILLLDNHRFLHGRSGFLDPERLFLRIRFN